jgi:hypothetical protein
LTSAPPIESIEHLTPPHSIIPEYKRATLLALPFSLADKPDSAFDANSRDAWTGAERIKAAKAPCPRSMVDLDRKVCVFVILSYNILMRVLACKYAG